MALSDEQQRRYARHILLEEIGREGQERLLAARILVIGAGGLGSAALSYLAAAGIGTLGIIDGDRVELSNLQRQILHETGDIGRIKVESARNRIEELNSDVKVQTHPFALTHENAAEIITQYDIVLDGCDNFQTRFLVNDHCIAQKKTLISAAIAGFSGQLSTFKAHLGAPHPCYRCLVPELPAYALTCRENGVIGPLCGVMGSLQAVEAIKELLAIGTSLSGKIVFYDGLRSTFRTTNLPHDPACKSCGN